MEGQAEAERVRHSAIVIEANVRMPLCLLDKGSGRQQNSVPSRRADQTHKLRTVNGADNNWLLSFARQERPKVVYIHMVSQPTDIDQPSGSGESKDSDDQYSEEETARRRDATVKAMISMRPKPHQPLTPKPKERAASKGRVHKGKTRS